MARRALWTGAISFGLVNIPIKMYSATQDRSIHFHMLHDQDKSRLQRRLVSAATGKEVHNEHIVRGFEIAKDQYVVVQRHEIESCAPEKSKTIEITDFVDLVDIDPLYYEKPYYLAPQPAATKPYRLLVEAMARAKKVAIARFVMHEKEHLAALRPIEDTLCLETMRFGDEVVPADEIGGVPASVKVGDRELKAAQQLIDSLSTKFDPAKYKDEYRDCIMKIVEQKARGEEVHVRPIEKQKTAQAADLMAALQASLAQAKQQATSKSGGGKRKKSV